MEDIKINLVKGELIIYASKFPWNQNKFKKLLKTIDQYRLYNDMNEIYMRLNGALRVSRAVWYGVGNVNKGKRCDKNIELLEVFKDEKLS